MSEHVAQPPIKISHPGGKDGFFRSDCSCGTYSSGYYAYPGHAEQATRDHAAAKNKASRAD